MRCEEDRGRLRELVRKGFNAARRIDGALTRSEPSPTWLRARMDEALAALARARNRLVIEQADNREGTAE